MCACQLGDGHARRRQEEVGLNIVGEGRHHWTCLLEMVLVMVMVVMGMELVVIVVMEFRFLNFLGLVVLKSWSEYCAKISPGLVSCLKGAINEY